MDSFETLFPESWLPRKPLASAEKSGAYRHVTRQRALELPYIEANPLVMQSLVITDRDASDADWAADLAGLPSPSYVSMNRVTTTGHIVYALKNPVCLTDAARRRPINLLARVEQGLCDVLGGDASYGHRITKNPLSTAHATLWGPADALYELRALAHTLDEIHALPEAGNPRRNVTRSTVGRNVTLFDTTRMWAYRAVRHSWGGPVAEWEHTVFEHIHLLNETIIADEFATGPLGLNELKHLSRSISRWVWRNFTPETFRARQKAISLRGASKGGIASGATRRAHTRQQFLEGLS